MRREQGFSMSFEEGLISLAIRCDATLEHRKLVVRPASSMPSNHGSSFFA